MTSRFGRRSDPFFALGATYAWRADDAVDNGTVTTSLKSYVGSLSLAIVGANPGQRLRAPSATLNGRQTITFATGGGFGGGFGAVAFGAAPTAITIASVIRLTSINRGWAALTAGGVTNSGVSQLALGDVRSRKLAVDATHASATPTVNIVHVTVVNASGITSYVNRKTPVTQASAGAVAGTTFQIGSVDSGNTFLMTGCEWATTGVIERAINGHEAAYLLESLGAEYGITIAA